MTIIKKSSLSVESSPNYHYHRSSNNSTSSRRILFLSLEFNFAPFSGNGVLCRSLVQGLLEIDTSTSTSQPDNITIRVVCAKPHPSTPHLSSDISVVHKNLEIWSVQLDYSSSQWKRLDRHSPWKEFATKCGNENDDDNGILKRIEQFQPTDVVAVDWHGMLAWQSIVNNNSSIITSCDVRPVVCYYNFRVYSSSSWGDDDNDDGDDDSQSFYKEKEQLSCRLADGIICLSEHDACALRNLNPTTQETEEEEETKKMQDISILPPPLRGDVCNLARMSSREGYSMLSSSIFDKYLPAEVRNALHFVEKQRQRQRETLLSNSQQQQRQQQQQQQRIFITCISRLSPEKSPHIFVQLLKKLGGKDFLRRHGLVPILCGARSVESYANMVVESFRSIGSSSSSSDDGDDESSSTYWPCIVIDHHLGPHELAAIFSHTAINIHPCLYDAYGMTLVESAAFGVPSVVNGGGKVGAAALLGENEGCIALDLSEIDDNCNEDEDCVKELIEKLSTLKSRNSSNLLTKIANEARCRALGYDEISCCRGLLDKLDSLHRENDLVVNP